MCTFISLVASTADAERLDGFMKRRGRRAVPVASPSLAKILRADEQHFLTTSEDCDCGTVLARAPEGEARPVSQEQENSGSTQRPQKNARHTDNARDDFAFWTSLVGDLLVEEQLPSVGLLVHAYSSDIADEDFAPVRREVFLSGALAGHLRELRADELLTVRLR